MLQVSKLYPPFIGGVEQVVRTVAEGLQDRTTMRVLVCNTREETERERTNGVEVTRAGSFALAGNMPLSLRFFREFRRASAPADILLFHMPFPLGDLASLLSRRRGRIVVWWHADVVRKRLLGALYRPIMKLFLRRVARIIVATPNHLRYTPVLAPYKDKCVIIPYGIDTKKYELTEEARRKAQEVRRQHGTPLILFVGRLVYYKGLETLVRVMADVEGHLVIVGQGPLEARLRLMAAAPAIASKVSFVGAVSDEDLRGYFHACDVFVLPSVAPSEAFGLVQLEAMASGKPVINTQLESGVPWVSIHGQTGLTVPPGDPAALAAALRALLRDGALRERYGANGRARARQLCDVSVMLESVMRVFDSLM